MNDYDVVMLCRSDVSDFFVSFNDILNVSKFKDILVVNSGTHVHAGGGGGCIKCSIESKCDAEFHYNDICDWWCMGSPTIMSKWNKFYDAVLDNYHASSKPIFAKDSHVFLDPMLPLVINIVSQPVIDTSSNMSGFIMGSPKCPLK
jgi:hypothetical protein